MNNLGNGFNKSGLLNITCWYTDSCGIAWIFSIWVWISFKISVEKIVASVDAKIDKNLLVPNARVACHRTTSAVMKVLPSLIDPLVSLMKVEKVPDSTYDMIGGLE